MIKLTKYAIIFSFLFFVLTLNYTIANNYFDTYTELAIQAYFKSIDKLDNPLIASCFIGVPQASKQLTVTGLLGAMLNSTTPGLYNTLSRPYANLPTNVDTVTLEIVKEWVNLAGIPTTLLNEIESSLNAYSYLVKPLACITPWQQVYVFQDAGWEIKIHVLDMDQPRLSTLDITRADILNIPDLYCTTLAHDPRYIQRSVMDLDSFFKTYTEPYFKQQLLERLVEIYTNLEITEPSIVQKQLYKMKKEYILNNMAAILHAWQTQTFYKNAFFQPVDTRLGSVYIDALDQTFKEIDNKLRTKDAINAYYNALGVPGFSIIHQLFAKLPSSTRKAILELLVYEDAQIINDGNWPKHITQRLDELDVTTDPTMLGMIKEYIERVLVPGTREQFSRGTVPLGQQTNSIYAYYTHPVYGTERIILATFVISLTILAVVCALYAYYYLSLSRAALTTHVEEIAIKLNSFNTLIEKIGPENLVSFFVIAAICLLAILYMILYLLYHSRRYENIE